MTRTSSILSAALFSLAAAFGVGCAQDPGPEVIEPGIAYNDQFEVWDTNDDGFLTEDEFGMGFDTWDSDGDGRITEDELGAAGFDTWDLDDDGYIDDDEYYEMHSTWDENNDGVLDEDEFPL